MNLCLEEVLFEPSTSDSDEPVIFAEEVGFLVVGNPSLRIDRKRKQWTENDTFLKQWFEAESFGCSSRVFRVIFCLNRIRNPPCLQGLKALDNVIQFLGISLWYDMFKFGRGFLNKIFWMWPWGVHKLSQHQCGQPTSPGGYQSHRCNCTALWRAWRWLRNLEPTYPHPQGFFLNRWFSLFTRWDMWSFPGKYPYLKCLGIDFEVFRAKVYGWKPKSSQGRRCWMNLNPLVWNGPLVRKDFPKSSATSSSGSRVPENSMQLPQWDTENLDNSGVNPWKLT